MHSCESIYSKQLSHTWIDADAELKKLHVAFIHLQAEIQNSLELNFSDLFEFKVNIE